ncbi:type I-E CRISPR-associated protein Cas5/CasD [Methanosphaerula subterraneus]|uniref:type I-E CRISPR-associated protein Cas5/CasD n=1 Tax=Methanosphaerula subterraneus TaxID=3350244 RepID=UPI003F8293D7
MSRDYLVFRLYGPMASWGGIAAGEDRGTLDHPTKSAVMGLVAAALGIERNEEEIHEQLHLQYRFAVRVDASGGVVRDFHTALIFKKPDFQTRKDEVETADEKRVNPMLTNRDYRTDAVYTVVLWVNSDESLFSLDTIRKALLSPHFPLSLGRKSCPLALPLEPQILKADDLKELFEKTHFKSDRIIAPLLRFVNPVWIFWEGDGEMEGFKERPILAKQHDMLLSRKRWQYRNRMESSVRFSNN